MRCLTSASLICLLSIFLCAADGYKAVRGLSVTRVRDRATVQDFGEEIASMKGETLLVFGTYAADFNMIEYAQRLRYYLPQLKEKGLKNFVLVANASPEATEKLCTLVDLPNDVTLYSDSSGLIGRAFGVSRGNAIIVSIDISVCRFKIRVTSSLQLVGWRPEDTDMNPYVKLLGMLVGLGAWATLPAVIGGYVGNPFTPQPWISESLRVGQTKGRWPDTALVLDSNGEIVENKFDALPGVGSWERRPLELATLRLQNMIGISLKSWNDLKPTDDELKSGLLTQLGGCVILNKDGAPKFEWRDAGICHVANFESILKKISS